MSCDVIRGIIINDTVSIPASGVFANFNPGHWTSPASVPRFLYTSIQDMASAHGNINNFTQVEYGLAETPSAFSIILQETDNCENADYPDYVDATGIPGATLMHMDILVSASKVTGDVYLVRDIGLRIRYLLDNQLRGLSGNVFCPELDPLNFISYDNTITPDYYKVRWDKTDALRGSQQAHHLTTAFVRTFV
jgi:hypothetical protein